jgi:hypothetical protein
MNLYLGLADDTLKGEGDETSIGLILCKTNNRIVAEYALRDTSKPIGIAQYNIAQILPEDIKGELPSIEEIEQRMDEEFKENQNPVDARLKAIKDKLKSIEADELRTPATYQILQNLFNEGLAPLYQKILHKLHEEFHEAYLTETKSWNLNGQIVNHIDDVHAFWVIEDNLRGLKELNFNYQLRGFKKAGTENFDLNLNLSFIQDAHWYGFVLSHYNGQIPYLKKMYHQPITGADVQTIIDLMVTQVLDKLEWIHERIKEIQKG